MAWPRLARGWPGGLAAAAAAHAELAQTIAAFEPVTMICAPEDAVEASLTCGAGIEVLPLAIGDGWLGDTGPTFLVNDSAGIAGIHWHPGDGQEGDADATIGRRLLDHLGLPAYAAPLALEPGAFSVDGAGTLLASERGLLGPRRNSGLDRGQVETHLRRLTGATTVIWLGGSDQEGSGGQVDEAACFVAPGVVLALTTDDPLDGNFQALHDNLDRLSRARDACGRPLEVVTVRQPARRPRSASAIRLTPSYTSFYLANGAVILPGFADAADQEARRTLRRLFPHREVVQVPALELAAAAVGLRRLTLPQPAPLPIPYDPVI